MRSQLRMFSKVLVYLELYKLDMNQSEFFHVLICVYSNRGTVLLIQQRGISVGFTETELRYTINVQLYFKSNQQKLSSNVNQNFLPINYSFRTVKILLKIIFNRYILDIYIFTKNQKPNRSPYFNASRKIFVRSWLRQNLWIVRALKRQVWATRLCV